MNDLGHHGGSYTIPFQSQSQRAYMFIHHPSIAKEWAAKYGGGGKNLPQHKGEMGGHGKQQLNMKPSGTPSNESWKPQLSVVPKIPGLRRDYSALKPSSAGRFIPKNKPIPNEIENSAQRGVEHMHGSDHHPQHKNVQQFKPSRLLGRDMSTAFNKEARQVHSRRGT